MINSNGNWNHHPISALVINKKERVGFKELTVTGSGRLGSFSMVIFLASSRFFSLLSLSSACTAKIEQTLLLHLGMNIWVQLKWHELNCLFKTPHVKKDKVEHTSFFSLASLLLCSRLKFFFAFFICVLEITAHRWGSGGRNTRDATWNNPMC